MKDGTALWTGESGRVYTYLIHALVEGCDLEVGRGPGNFIFARFDPLLEWQPVFIGQTSDLGARLNDHRTRASAAARGATHVHAHVNLGGARALLDEEQDLVEAYKPPCNQW